MLVTQPNVSQRSQGYITNLNVSHIPQFCVSITQQAETADGADVYWNRQIITA